MFSRDDLPEFRTNLVSALTSLNVYDFPHFWCSGFGSCSLAGVSPAQIGTLPKIGTNPQNKWEQHHAQFWLAEKRAKVQHKISAHFLRIVNVAVSRNEKPHSLSPFCFCSGEERSPSPTEMFVSSVVPENISFPKTEEEVLAYWQQIDAFQESLRRSQGKPEYSFYDGPPFATGLPHYGHILAGTIKVGISFTYTHSQACFLNTFPHRTSSRDTRIKLGIMSLGDLAGIPTVP